MRKTSFEIDFDKLYEIASCKKEGRVLESDLYVLKKILEHNYESKLFFEDLSVPKESRKKFLREIFPSSSKVFWQLIDFLIDIEEVDLLSGISEAYTRFIAQKEDVDFAELSVSQDLPADAINKIKNKFGKNLLFKIVKNPEILGGFVIKKIDGTVIDCSLKRRLEDLKRGIIK